MPHKPIHANAIHTPIQDQRFVAVVGLHSSGSSALAGVLYHLGLHLGNKLVGFYGSNPEKSCGFEAIGLVQICVDVAPYPSTTIRRPMPSVEARLRKWIQQRQAEAVTRNTIAAGKYPLLCRLGSPLVNICGQNLLVVHIDRPIEESIASLVRRDKKLAEPAIRAHQEWLDAGKRELLANIPANRQITVQYTDLLANPIQEIDRLASFLQISPTEAQRAKAASYVKPEKRHINLGGAS